MASSVARRSAMTRMLMCVTLSCGGGDRDLVTDLKLMLCQDVDTRCQVFDQITQGIAGTHGERVQVGLDLLLL